MGGRRPEFSSPFSEYYLYPTRLSNQARKEEAEAAAKLLVQR